MIFEPLVAGVGADRKRIGQRFQVACALAALALFSAVAQAQMQRQTSVSSPELARDNLSQVAASSGEIKTVLVQDPGLMVELKRWVAEDATDQGQIVSESDLTEDAIFERLDSDVRFRAVATVLLQRYGYLIPTVNPDSELGKEQELLVQERVKWIFQEEEQAAQAASQAQDKLAKAQECEQGDRASCPKPQQQRQRQLPAFQPQGPGQETIPGLSPDFGEPNQLNPPSAPLGGGDDMLERATLMQTASPDSSSSPLLNGNSLNATGLFGGSGGLGETSSPSMLQSLQNQDDGGLSSAGGGVGPVQSGMLNQYLSGGSDLGSSIDQTDINPFEMNKTGQMNGAGAPGYNNSPFLGYRQPFNRNYQNQSMLEPVEMVRQPSPYNDIPSLYDMYMQASPHPAEPTRFGVNVFDNDAQNPYFIPIDLPAGPDYVVGPGDGFPPTKP